MTNKIENIAQFKTNVPTSKLLVFAKLNAIVAKLLITKSNCSL